MSSTGRTEAGAALTALIIEIFKSNGALLKAGDTLVSGLGLSSARWQVLGAVALAGQPETVSRLARMMGLKRQGVQRIVNEMVAEDVLVLRENPHHRTSPLVVFTRKGADIYGAAEVLQTSWVNGLDSIGTVDQITAATTLLQAMGAKLAAD